MNDTFRIIYRESPAVAAGKKDALDKNPREPMQTDAQPLSPAHRALIRLIAKKIVTKAVEDARLLAAPSQDNDSGNDLQGDK